MMFSAFCISADVLFEAKNNALWRRRDMSNTSLI